VKHVTEGRGGVADAESTAGWIVLKVEDKSRVATLPAHAAMHYNSVRFCDGRERADRTKKPVVRHIWCTTYSATSWKPV